MLLFAFFGLLGMQLFAQKTITGTVTSADDGSTLPGVSVVVKGTTIATVSDIDGKYVLNNVPSDATTLVFSLVGMATQEVPISGDVVDCALEPSQVEVGTVVVTALGVTRETKSLGYAVQEVNGDDLNVVKSNNFVSQLSGKVAGVQIQTNTNFGGSVNVLVRGSSSLTGNNQALFVVDGVPIDNTTYNSSYQNVGGRGYDYGSGASDINPDDIESVTVLKGAAATALYGSRAANGVILITTKKAGKNKALGVSVGFSGMVGMIDKTTFPTYQKEYGAGYGPFGEDPTGYFFYTDVDGDGTDDLVTQLTEDASYGPKFDQSLMVYQWNSLYPGLTHYHEATPWVAAEHDPSYFFNKAYNYTTNVQVTGGNDKGTYRLSYQNMIQTGILPNSKLMKNNVSLNATYDITKKLHFTTFANYINQNAIGRNTTGYAGNIMSSFRQWWQVNVDILEQKDAYNQLGYNVTWNPNYVNNLSPIYWNNFYFQRYNNYETDGKNRLIGYSKIDYDVADFLTLTARASVDFYNLIQEERLAVGSVAEAFGVNYPDQKSGYGYRTRQFMENNYDLFANFHKDFSENFTMRALVGANFRHTDLQTLFASTNGGLVVPGLYALSNSRESNLAPDEYHSRVQVNGYFANLSIGLMKFLFLEGSARVDQSSTLPLDNNTYVYPSASLSFVFSELLDADWLSLGKIRFNYAQVGNDAPWASLNDVYLANTSLYGNAMYSPSTTLRNPELRPERLRSLETGLTMNFFNNRVGFDLTLYKNNSFDQIMPIAVSYATGSVSKYINAGNIENKGIELALNLTPVKTKSGFEWDMNINWTKNKNKVLELAPGVDNIQLARLQGGVSINATVGQPYGNIQGTDYVYVDPDNPTPDTRIVNSSGYYRQTATSDYVIGNVQPDWLSGLRNTITYKGLSFTFLIDWKHGGDIFSLDQWYGMGTGLYPETAGTNDLGNPVRDDVIQTGGTDVTDVTYDPASGGVILKGVQEVVDGTDTTYVDNIVRAYAGWFANPWGWYRAPNAMHIYDASYIKLREVALNYTFPSKIFGGSFIKGASIGFVGNNLWILYKKLPYADPEATQSAGNIQGWQSGTLPSVRYLGFNVSLKF